jgi:hypothetical protein
MTIIANDAIRTIAGSSSTVTATPRQVGRRRTIVTFASRHPKSSRRVSTVHLPTVRVLAGVLGSRILPWLEFASPRERP